MIKLFVLQGNEWSRSYRETNQHPSLPWNFITHGFLDLSGTGDSQRIDSRESFAIEIPIFIARQADSHESLEFPIHENANRANGFVRITPLSSGPLCVS